MDNKLEIRMGSGIAVVDRFWKRWLLRSPSVIYRGKLKGPWSLGVDFVGSRGDLGLKGFRV